MDSPAHHILRLIPAHAGKTSEAVVSITHLPAHPRSRGENITEQGWDAYALGSSPLTRGKRQRHGHGTAPPGLIPAHAGKTECCLVGSAGGGAHPRSRGENSLVVLRGAGPRGSSPLTRGKRIVVFLVFVDEGLIPAHAGKTSLRRPILSLPWAHPRSRGENAWSDSDSTRTRGSSPLTRGKPAIGHTQSYDKRLIPAHAGKT